MTPRSANICYPLPRLLARKENLCYLAVHLLVLFVPNPLDCQLLGTSLATNREVTNKSEFRYEWKEKLASGKQRYYFTVNIIWKSKLLQKQVFFVTFNSSGVCPLSRFNQVCPLFYNVNKNSFKINWLHQLV